MAANDFGAIYDLGTSDLKASIPKERFERLLASINGKTTGCQEPQWVRSNFAATTSGSFTTMIYSRDCPDGPLAETFVVKLEGEAALLHGYNANAAFLIMDGAPADSSPPPPAPAIAPRDESPAAKPDAIPT